MLLDLPWDRPFTIVDLRENVDFELMVTFYEMMTEVYGRDNLLVLDEWLNAISSSSSNQQKGWQGERERERERERKSVRDRERKLRNVRS